MGLGFVQIHFEFREGLVQHRNNLRQQVRANGWDQANMQRAGHGFPLLACHFLEHFDLAQHGARLIHQQQTGLGEQHFTTGALQQHHAQLILKLADLTAQRGLADVAGICRAAKMTMLS
ncbi:hypothetical protein D3C85_1316880 [compost metagenome]